jgi:GAF domain-containing protein/HAMP domain-containing protein
MNNWLSKRMAGTTPEGRHVLLIAVIMLAASLPALPIMLLLSNISGWQLTAGAVGLGVVAFMAAAAALLARRNRALLATGLLIGMLYLVMPFMTALYSGQGLIMSATLFIMVALIVGQTLSGRAAAGALLGAALFSILTLLIDQYATWPRLSLPQTQTLLPVLAGSVVLLLGFFVVRDFRNYSLRTKLTVAFLVVTLIPLVTLAIYYNVQARAQILLATQQRLGALAGQTADTVDAFVSNQLSAIGLASQNPDVTGFLALDPAQRAGSSQAGSAQAFLNTLVAQDQKFIRSYGLVGTDGVVVLNTSGQTGQNEFQADFFRRALAADHAVVSGPFFNEKTGAASLYFSTPVTGPDGSTLGVMYADYDAGVIESLVEQLVPTGNPDKLLFRVVDNTNYIRIAHTANTKLLYLPYKNLSPDQITTLQNQGLLPPGSTQLLQSAVEADTSAGLQNLDQNAFFTTVSKTLNARTLNTGAALKTVPWLALVRQSEATVLAPLDAQTRTIVFISLVLIALVTLAAFAFAQFLSGPILQLSSVTQRITHGDLTARAHVVARDEIGALAASFNDMTGQLQDLIGSLEQRVADRTKELQAATDLMTRRAAELQSVAQIATQASKSTDIQSMLQTVVDLTKAKYDLYHAHIYLLDEARQKAVLAAGAGDVGRQMVSQNRFIPLDHPHSLVARAARTGEGAISNDVTLEPDFLPNPLLPSTRSEMAIPVSSGDTVLGVLDVQADFINRFTNEDVAINTTLAQQVASSLENLRQYQVSQKMARELGVVATVSTSTASITDLNRLLQEVVDQTKASFGLYHAHIYLLNEAGDTLVLTAGAGEVGKQMVAEGRRIPLDSEKSLVARAARTRSGVVVNDVHGDPDFLPHPLLPHTQSEQAVPMIAGDRVIGVLDVQSDQLNRFTESDINIETTLAAQVAVALQNARSFEQAKRQAERESALNVIGQKIQGATTVEAVLQIAARELGRALNAPLTIAQLGMKNGNGSSGNGNGH